MGKFIHPDFVLESKTAQKLYHDYAEKLPIVDFHCHLSPKLIADNHKFESLGQIWLEGDHYKWRAMRTNGVDEEYCTGNTSFRDKFQKWAETVPSTIGNPLHHWTHLELARHFDIFDLLAPENAGKIYDKATEMLQQDEFRTQNLLKKMNVEVVGTTDDPADSLQYHQALKNFSIKVRPTFRPDNVLKTEDPEFFNAYISKLESVSGKKIKTLRDLISVLDERHAFFNEVGCKASDHGLDRLYYTPNFLDGADKSFEKVRNGEKLSDAETEGYRTYVMYELCKMNHKRGWVQQFHLGAMRNNNTRMFKKLGPDVGFDSIGNPQDANKISRFMDLLDTEDKLAKTILYNLNPSDNEMFVTMLGNFQDGKTPGKIQYGAGWWFLDQKVGMEKHLRDLSVLGLLARFVGMVTDSRSFLSYPRHEYFRRILCNHLGQEIDKGLIPNDQKLLKTVIEDICYHNPMRYFGF
ncbi:glucuronate isomerase [Alkalitalea saponilacus]|uniref:Uronate isomerase n=1 Tax=Alkalitalea saponilacus TaxID=889453 RepID=A0A1T5G5Q6_9BACT|nr:glucuronate isomerase [Alkalitalea saponilacus]ASB47864.1 glucuronate isomerase [Alkalitalea saponilacus]SKC03785.1 glucuronate isomerase [Alkalitalea saponilacus]